jgi:hypothetical protein
VNTRNVTDLPLAAFLVASGHRLLSMACGTNGRGAFTFEECPKLDQAVLDFYNSAGRVEPRAFSETIRSLKAAVRST